MFTKHSSMAILHQNKSLRTYNTFGIDVKAQQFAVINTEAELGELMQKRDHSLPFLVLGGGSNVLFTKDFDGLVIKMNLSGIEVAEAGDEVLVTAGAGVVWNDCVQFCVQRGYGGIENLTLIPGTVGASPIQNIGAYGVEIKDVFETCRAYELATGAFRHFSHKECRFGYRESIFKNELKGQYIITSVTFRLQKKPVLHIGYGAIADELRNRRIDKPGIADVSAVVADIRVSKLPDPSTIGNAGSFFKNPVIEAAQFEALLSAFPAMVHYPTPAGKVKIAAGWLIEQCGFKGVVSGHTGTWKNQALVLVNHGGATGSEVYDFSEYIIEEVHARFGIRLEREVNIF